MSTPPDSQAIRPPVKRRRVIFNSDGFGVFKDAHGDLYRWLHNLFDPLEETQVEALFWCDGAGGNTAYYDSRVLELTGQRAGNVSPFLRRLIAEGNDPPKVVTRWAKKRGLDVFYSFRINDVHDDFMPEEFPTFKAEHPEWLIGEGHPYGIRTALNFAIPEVRKLKLEVVKEIFEKYDFDGLEIDFMRSPPFFIPGQEQQHAPLLTELLREIRHSLNARAQVRGRPIELAARVGETLEACRLDGFEVQTWIEEGLVDLLILGSGAIDIAVEEFKALAEGHNVLIYPCLYGWPSRYTPIPAALARGLAANYWSQGADGIYTFNWFPHEVNKRYQIALLNEIGDPQRLQGKTLMFAAERGRPQNEYPHNWLRARLPATLRGKQELSVPLLMGADLSIPPQSVALCIEHEGLLEDGTLEVFFNGQKLSAGRRSDDMLELPLSASQLRRGQNLVTLRRDGRQLTINGIELHVNYD